MPRIAADATVFYAIADPTRRTILDVLREEGERTVAGLLEKVERVLEAVGGITQSAFSQHLAVLRRVGLVSVRKEGRARVYAFRPEPLREVVDWAMAYEKFWDEKLDNLGHYLDRTHGRQAPDDRGTT